jgi:hypothetical protein
MKRVRFLMIPVVFVLMSVWAAMPSTSALEFRTANRWISTALFSPWYCQDAWMPDIYNAEDIVTALENRIIVRGSIDPSWHYTAHIVTTADYSTRAHLKSQADYAGVFSGEFYRHSDLTWTWMEPEIRGEYLTGITFADRLFLSYRSDVFSITAGRQPIGLSTCFYLTANDFFQPFSAEAIYRDYKPGVDAVVMRYFTGALSETGIYAVAGYDKDGAFDGDEAAVLARTSFTTGGFQWELLAGKLPWRLMAGAAFQGEIGSFGVRAEGHVNVPQNGYETAFGTIDSDNYIHVSGGVDYRFSNSLHLFFEYFYRGNGYASYDDYLMATVNAGAVRDIYAARHYAVAAATYQWHPLVTSQVFGLVNLDDSSMLMSAFGTFSLANEADLVIGGYYTLGDKPECRVGWPYPRSEFGSADRAISLELRVYL